ncbi:MAG: GPMC system MBL fold metallohydrolase [Desulfuromonas sp.]|nr:GPMC system MBL fold metallohydrolase [Desulfuromonas sp.]
MQVDSDTAPALKTAGVTITILGSGTSTGVPVVGCDCPVCTSDEVRNKRSRCSALLSWDGHNVLIDTSPDLRQQSLVNNIRQIDAVLYTHGHADHVHGIDDLRVFNVKGDGALPIYGSAALIERLTRSFGYVFSWKNRGFCPLLQPIVLTEAITLFGRRLVPIALVHGSTPVFGYRVGDIAYLTDCVGLAPQAWAQLQGLQVLVIDGLRFRDHPTHFTVAQAIAVAQRLGARRVVLTHLSHDVDYVRDSEKLPENVEFAYDGLTITVADSSE